MAVAAPLSVAVSLASAIVYAGEAGSEPPVAGAEPHASKRASTEEREGETIEHTIVVGVGGAVDLELKDGALHPGPSVFVEYEAIPTWLELELGASVLFAEGGIEIPIDLLVKKPFRLSDHVEFMLGAGPEVVHASGTSEDGTFAGIEVVADFMFWPSQRVGFWIAPEYDIVFRERPAHALGATGGLLLGW